MNDMNYLIQVTKSDGAWYVAVYRDLKTCNGVSRYDSWDEVYNFLREVGNHYPNAQVSFTFDVRTTVEKIVKAKSFTEGLWFGFSKPVLALKELVDMVYKHLKG